MSESEPNDRTFIGRYVDVSRKKSMLFPDWTAGVLRELNSKLAAEVEALCWSAISLTDWDDPRREGWTLAKGVSPTIDTIVIDNSYELTRRNQIRLVVETQAPTLMHTRRVTT